MAVIKVGKLKYAIPSLFTLCALFFSFYALLQSASGSFNNAVYSVILAMIFDSLDGRSARLTNTVTPFGASFDSITDMMAYGVAPSMMIYCWGLFRLGKIGYLVCFIFCACAGLRLARFNVMPVSNTSKKYLQGLSSTIAGGFVVSFILVCIQHVAYSNLIFAAALTVFTSILMVSNLKFYSFKEFGCSPRLSALILSIILVALIFLTYKFKGLILFGSIAVYIIINLVLQPIYAKK